MSDDRHARISEEAYRLWKEEGEPHGRDREHWDQAERAFAGEGPVADEPDPQVAGDSTELSPDSDAAGDSASVSEAQASETTPPEALGSDARASEAIEPAPKSTAKKPVTRRRRTT